MSDDQPIGTTPLPTENPRLKHTIHLAPGDRRLLLAGMVLQGWYAGRPRDVSISSALFHVIAAASVEQADALLAQLDKPK